MERHGAVQRNPFSSPLSYLTRDDGAVWWARMTLPLVPFLRLRECEEPFVMCGERWLFVTCLRADGMPDIGVYRFSTDLTHDYMAWREAFNLR